MGAIYGDARVDESVWDYVYVIAEVSGKALGPCWIPERSFKSHPYYKTHFETGKQEYIHRYMYRRLVGEIPPGLELDHLCRVPSCCNPDHLDPVTHQENMSRGKRGMTTHCPKGHEYNEKNTYYRKNRRGRVCRVCQMLYNRERYGWKQGEGS